MPNSNPCATPRFHHRDPTLCGSGTPLKPLQLVPELFEVFPAQRSSHGELFLQSSTSKHHNQFFPMAFEQVSIVLVGLAVVTVLGFTALAKVTETGEAPAGIPWICVQDGFFSGLRTRIASLSGLLDSIESGYEKVCQFLCIRVSEFNAIHLVFKIRTQLCLARL